MSFPAALTFHEPGSERPGTSPKNIPIYRTVWFAELGKVKSLEWSLQYVLEVDKRERRVHKVLASSGGLLQFKVSSVTAHVRDTFNREQDKSLSPNQPFLCLTALLVGNKHLDSPRQLFQLRRWQ